jgi:hypothetical protein
MAEEYEVEASRLDGKFTRVVDFSQIAMMILPGGITIMKNMGIHKLLLLIYVELRQEEGIQVHFNLFLIVCFYYFYPLIFLCFRSQSKKSILI